MLARTDYSNVLFSDSKQMLDHSVIVHALRIGSPSLLSYVRKRAFEIHILGSRNLYKLSLAVKVASSDTGKVA